MLIGQTSGAVAVVKDRRFMIISTARYILCSFPKNDANPRWATGIRTIRFTTSDIDSVPGAVDFLLRQTTLHLEL